MPVTVKLYVVAVVELHETVALSFPTILDGVTEPHVSPDGAIRVREMAPVNPLIEVTAIVDVAEEPAFTADGVVTVMVKSGGVPNVKVAVAWWLSEPLVPVITTL